MVFADCWYICQWQPSSVSFVVINDFQHTMLVLECLNRAKIDWSHLQWRTNSWGSSCQDCHTPFVPNMEKVRLRIWIYISEYISCWMLEVWAALKAPTSNLNTANRRSAQLWIIVSWNFSVGHHHHLDNPHHHHDTQFFLYQGVNWPTDRAILGVWYSVYLCLSRRQIYLGTLHRHITFCVWEWEQPSQHCFSSCNTQTHLIIIIGRVQLKYVDLHDMDACDLTSMRI